MYGMGVAVADYDNDGRNDVFITALEGDRLFHNEGHFRFRDVTPASGIQNANFAQVPPGSTTIGTAWWIFLSRIMCNGAHFRSSVYPGRNYKVVLHA